MRPKRRSLLTALAFLAAGGLLSVPAANAEDTNGRYALVIGNSAYSGEVVSGVEDAMAMADHLKQAGFSNPTLLLNRNRKEMIADLEEFGKGIADASVVVFFYSGHGFQLSGQNYLRPIHGDIAPNSAVPLSLVTSALAKAPRAVKIIFLDACRDVRNLPPGALKGLAEMTTPEKTVVAFAAAPGQLAASGNANTVQKLSPYTEALLRYIREPGLELLEFLASVHRDVALRGTGQSPTEFGLSHLGGEPFYLREPVYVKAKIDDVDDSMIVFLGSDIVLQGSQGEEHKPEKLRLKAGDNVLKLFVSNEKTFRRNQNWERPEGWKYRFQIYPADGEPLICSERTEAPGCFSGRERVPFKDGRRHGKLFQVAQVNLFVDPVTAKLTINRDDTLWSKDTPAHEQKQGVLFERMLFDLPLSRILTNEWAELAITILQVVAPEPEKIFVTARGNLEAKEEVEACMADEETWIEKLRESISLAMQHDPKPFDPFDDAITKCAQGKDPSLGEKKIRVYTAVEDRHGEEPEESLAVVGNAAPGREASVASLADGPSEEGDLRDRLARMFSPIGPAPYQLAAVRASAAQLTKLSGQPLLYASVSAADLQAHLPASVEARFKLARADGRAQVAKVELRDQEVVVWTALEITRPATKLTLLGEAEIHAAVAVERGALVLRPSVETVHFTRAEDDSETPAPLLALLVRVLLGDVSQALAIQRIPLRVEGLRTLDLASLLDGMGGVTQVNAQPVGLNVGLGAAALLVDATGVHVLADAVVLTPKRFAETVEKLSQNVGKDETPPFTSDQLAVLGECGQPLPLAEPLTRTFAAVCAAFVDLTLTETPMPTETPEEAEAALGRELEAFQKDFRNKVDAVEPGIPLDRTLVALSRSQISVGLNEILQEAVVQATLRPEGFQGEIPEGQRRIRTPEAPKLHCDQVGRACPSVFTYPPYHPRGCNSNCGFFDLNCHREKAECEIVKESERVAYEAAKAAAQAAFGAEKAACEAVKVGEQTGCKANQGWLDLVAGKEVGELQGRFDVRDINLPLTLDQVRVGADFETIDLRLEATGGGEVSGHLSARPLNEGHLVCLAPWDASLKARVSLPRQQRSLQLRRTGAELTSDEELRLTYELAATPLQLKIEPPPIQAFLEQNGAGLALSCPVPAFVTAGLGGFPGAGFPLALSLRNEILRDTFDVSLPVQEIPIVIPSQTIPVGEGEPIRLIPSWGEKAIVFEAR